jgi:hypothetical protein
MVGPGIFEAVGEKFNGLCTFRSQHEKSGRRSTESANHPKNIFHRFVPSRFVLRGVGCGPGDFVCLLSICLRGEDGALADRTGNSYTLGMDSVRFGRALGMGARAAAKTLVTAVDAATAPNPSASPSARTADTTARPNSAAADAVEAKVSGARLAQQAARTTAQVKQTGRGLKQGSKRFGEAAWGPFVRLSGVLWLELTGVFFGIFAVFAIGGTWRMRGEWRQTAINHDARMHLVVTAAMAVAFSYFCVSSFVQASRRGRGR